LKIKEFRPDTGLQRILPAQAAINSGVGEMDAFFGQPLLAAPSGNWINQHVSTMPAKPLSDDAQTRCGAFSSRSTALNHLVVADQMASTLCTVWR
jgi:hypothetical protein